MDVTSSGIHYTWTQKPKGDGGVLRKLDRIMSNEEFIDTFSPIESRTTRRLNFLELVDSNWTRHVDGHNMFKVVTKLKLLKKPMRKLLHDQGNLHERVEKLQMELDTVQKALDSNPANLILREEEAAYVQAFNEAKLDEERFLKQKSKEPTSRIELILNSDNVEILGNLVSDVFVSHYEQFLGTSMDCNTLNMEGLFSKTVPMDIAYNMVRPVMNEEIKAAMFDIGDKKAPGPDGYTSVFFKKGWSIIGPDICNVIRDFYSNGQILKEINHTFLALIPKVATPLKVNDYRPISCCNVIYKCISKILTKRVIEGIKEVVSDNQSAFISGRHISNNILITQELMHNYHKKKGPPRCAFKIDIQKAYDTVDWRFLEHILIRFGFHNTMVRWIMACVSSTSFSLSINRNIHGYFKGKRGLRQGDPLSPYLFTLVMEILTLILKRRVRLSDLFRFHRHCEEIQLINVCFANDLFIFARGDVESARVIMESLKEFKLTSGLVPSLPKSMACFCNVVTHIKNAILNIMPFSEGELPVKYLGVPLISSRLLIRDRKVLMEKAKNRIGDWKNKSLSFAGHLQLFIRGFLWCNEESIRGKAKVSWDEICLPKKEGGFGLRLLDIFNYALMTTHIWNIVSSKESLWVPWIHTYKLRGHSFWDVPMKSDMSWGWHKLLPLRETVKLFFSPRDITREGFHLQNKVADLIVNGVWAWPQAWLHKAPDIGTIAAPVLDVLQTNVTQWRDYNGTLSSFLVAKAWEAIRPRGNQVGWFRIVWFYHNIPRHAFHLWLVMRQGLKTHDRMKQ
ncbi:hypothetical protein Tco_0099430 [Tanacetum coccineum]